MTGRVSAECIRACQSKMGRGWEDVGVQVCLRGVGQKMMKILTLRLMAGGKSSNSLSRGGDIVRKIVALVGRDSELGVKSEFSRGSASASLDDGLVIATSECSRKERRRERGEGGNGGFLENRNSRLEVRASWSHVLS